MHRLMGGWASLTSSAEYMQLSVAEQFSMTSRFALCTTRASGPSDDSASVSMDSVACLQLDTASL
jgi:hypothetical protein